MRLNVANNIINLDRKRNRRSRANSARWDEDGSLRSVLTSD